MSHRRSCADPMAIHRRIVGCSETRIFWNTFVFTLWDLFGIAWHALRRHFWQHGLVPCTNLLILPRFEHTSTYDAGVSRLIDSRIEFDSFKGHALTMHRKPTWLVEVSMGSACRAAGR